MNGQPPRQDDADGGRRNLERKLRRRIRIYSLVFLVMLFIVIADVVLEQIGSGLALAGLGAGVLLGLAASRMFRIFRSRSTGQITARVDRFGAVIIGLYVVFVIMRRWLFSHWLSGSAVPAFTFSVISGLMLGRTLGLEISISQALARRGSGTAGHAPEEE